MAAVLVVLAVVGHNRNDEAAHGSAKSKVTSRPRLPMQPALKKDANADPEGPLRLNGRVIGADGNAIVGAEVWIDSAPRRSTQTGSDGAFAFDGLLGRAYTVFAKSGDLVGGPHAVRLFDKSAPIVLRLTEGAHVLVTVVDVAGAPIENATLRVLTDGTVARTDAKRVKRGPW